MHWYQFTIREWALTTALIGGTIVMVGQHLRHANELELRNAEISTIRKTLTQVEGHLAVVQNDVAKLVRTNGLAFHLDFECPDQRDLAKRMIGNGRWLFTDSESVGATRVFVVYSGLTNATDHGMGAPVCAAFLYHNGFPIDFYDWDNPFLEPCITKRGDSIVVDASTLGRFVELHSSSTGFRIVER